MILQITKFRMLSNKTIELRYRAKITQFWCIKCGAYTLRSSLMLHLEISFVGKCKFHLVSFTMIHPPKEICLNFCVRYLFKNIGGVNVHFCPLIVLSNFRFWTWSGKKWVFLFCNQISI